MSQLRRPPAQPTRKKKRKAPEELPSSATVEITGFIQKGGRLVRDRVIEPAQFDPRIPPTLGPSFDESIFFDPSPPEDTSQPVDASDDPTPNVNARRSVSVGHSFCHVTVDSSLLQAKIQDWLPENITYLYEILRHEARPCGTSCHRCTLPAMYYCSSCVSGEWVCGGCLLLRHATSPLHVVRVCVWLLL